MAWEYRFDQNVSAKHPMVEPLRFVYKLFHKELVKAKTSDVKSDFANICVDHCGPIEIEGFWGFNQTDWDANWRMTQGWNNHDFWAHRPLSPRTDACRLRHAMRELVLGKKKRTKSGEYFFGRFWKGFSVFFFLLLIRPRQVRSS